MPRVVSGAEYAFPVSSGASQPCAGVVLWRVTCTESVSLAMPDGFVQLMLPPCPGGSTELARAQGRWLTRSLFRGMLNSLSSLSLSLTVSLCPCREAFDVLDPSLLELHGATCINARHGGICSRSGEVKVSVCVQRLFLGGATTWCLGERNVHTATRCCTT